MPLNRYIVRVDPQGKAMDVDILDMDGDSVAAFDSPQFAASARTLPLTITTQTDFCLPSPGTYDVSCKVSGQEVALAGSAKRVQVSEQPVLVVPDWSRELAEPAAPVPSAADIAYDPTDSGLAATDVQAAVDEVAGGLLP